MITLEPADLAGLEPRWQAWPAPSFFRSWTWIGCRAAARFDQPYLLAESGVSLALLNRRGGRFYANETGDPAHDAVYIEHNGAGSAAAMRLVLRAGRLRLSGVDAAAFAAAREAGVAVVRARASAPFADLAACRGPGAGLDRYLARLSANTRGQIRRSLRLLAQEGAVHGARAPTLPAAQAAFAAMVELHQASWQARGQPGAFAGAEMVAFHRALIERGFARGEVDLFQVTAGTRIVGVLYNFLYKGRVLAYQSGFAAWPSRVKPGLTCHALAIGHYIDQGFAVYDFLAGADRYKTSLGEAGPELYWIDLYARHSPRGWAAAAAVAAKLRAAHA